MSEKISKISVDGVVYDIASTGGGEVPGDIQEQLSALENKVTEEASVREEGDAKLSEKIESEASRVDGMVNQINENVASSIETLNNNLVQAIETINGGVAAEVTNREEGDAKLQAAIDELAEKVNGEDADFTKLEEKIKKNAADIATVNSNLVEAVDNINKNMVDGFNTINGGIDNEIRPELEKAVKYEDTATEQNPGRKTIFMNNHDNICGYTTDGSAVNIAMVSKWNKVDLGSSSVEINLNGSAERPTYNDSKQIALLEDVHGNMETIALVKKDDLTYELQVGDKIAGTINIPADQFLKSVEYSAEDKSLTFVFNTSEGEQISVVDLSSLVDTYVAGNGIELIGNGFSIKLDPSSESYLSVSEAGIKVEGIDEIKKNVQEVAANLVTVNENLASSIDAINKNMVDSFNTINGGINNEIRPELEKAVKYEDVADSNLPERKAIVLKNGDVILGGNLEGGTSSLVQLNRWGVADFGSASVPFNINTPKDVRPTVQEAGQSGEEAHKIAYLSDIVDNSADLEEIKEALSEKADKSDVNAISEKLDSKADKDSVVEYQELGEGRKTIQLANYDSISGIDTKGTGHNLAMVSKWDKADFGAAGLELNLNGSAERPTYNDTEEIALVKDIQVSSSDIDELKAAVEGKADKSELEGAVKYQEFGENRKTIQLANYDSISGVATDGTGHNLVMLSKWDKADFGAPGVKVNLNGSEARPTYNDDKEIALLEDIEAANDKYISYKELESGAKTIELANGDSLSGVNSEGVAGFNLAKVTAENKVEIGSAGMDLNLVGSEPRPMFNGSKGIALSEELEAKATELQDSINLKASQSDLEAYMSATDTKVSELEGKIGNIPTKVSELENDSNFQSASQVDARIQEVVAAAPEALDTLKELADALGNDPDFAGTVTAELSKKANSANVYTKEEADSKFITEHQSLEDYATKEEVNSVKSSIKVYTSGEGININENDKVSVKISEQERHLNVSPDGSLQFSYSFKKVGPWYYQFLDKNGNQVSNTDTIDFNTEYDSLSNIVNQKAWQVHLDKANATIEALSSTVEILKQKIDSITKTNVQSVVVSGEASDLTDAEKDYIVSGSINKNSTITGKSISLKSIKVSDARLKLNADDVESKDLNISGSFPKADGNTAVSVNNAEFIVFKDMVFNASEIYNGIEIGLAENSVLPKNILFDNCKFQGDFSNNAILVFGTQDNAVITLSNCYFEKISNALRLSNKSNAKGVVVNINNCTVDQWETRTPWQGFLICEDYTSKSEEEANTNNLFGDGKIIVNFNNLIHAGEKVNPTDPASVCGTKNDDQVVFVCRDAVTNPEDSCLSYDQAKFPVVSFK
jgi:hypothetical protein